MHFNSLFVRAKNSYDTMA